MQNQGVNQLDKAKKSFKLAVNLAWISFAFSCINGLYIINTTAMSSLSGILVLLGFIFPAFIIYKISKARNWARLVFMFFGLVGLLMLIVTVLTGTTDQSLFSKAISVIDYIFLMLSLYLLFSSPVADFFQGTKKNTLYVVISGLCLSVCVFVGMNYANSVFSQMNKKIAYESFCSPKMLNEYSKKFVDYPETESKCMPEMTRIVSVCSDAMKTSVNADSVSNPESFDNIFNACLSSQLELEYKKIID